MLKKSNVIVDAGWGGSLPHYNNFHLSDEHVASFETGHLTKNGKQMHMGLNVDQDLAGCIFRNQNAVIKKIPYHIEALALSASPDTIAAKWHSKPPLIATINGKDEFLQMDNLPQDLKKLIYLERARDRISDDIGTPLERIAEDCRQM